MYEAMNICIGLHDFFGGRCKSIKMHVGHVGHFFVGHIEQVSNLPHCIQLLVYRIMSLLFLTLHCYALRVFCFIWGFPVYKAMHICICQSNFFIDDLKSKTVHVGHVEQLSNLPHCRCPTYPTTYPTATTFSVPRILLELFTAPIIV